MNKNSDEAWVRKFGDELTFALETTVRFWDTNATEPFFEPFVQQSAWLGGIEFIGATLHEFRFAAMQTAEVAQFNGQRRSGRCQDMDAATAFSMIWSTNLGGDHPYFFDSLSAARLTAGLIPLVENGRYSVAIGTLDYRLRFLSASDAQFLVNPVEVEMTIADFEIPLAETMKFLESVAKLYELDWRDVLMSNYRAHW
jgi:hypothetical protein